MSDIEVDISFLVYRYSLLRETLQSNRQHGVRVGSDSNDLVLLEEKVGSNTVIDWMQFPMHVPLYVSSLEVFF